MTKYFKGPLKKACIKNLNVQSGTAKIGDNYKIIKEDELYYINRFFRIVTFMDDEPPVDEQEANDYLNEIIKRNPGKNIDFNCHFYSLYDLKEYKMPREEEKRLLEAKKRYKKEKKEHQKQLRKEKRNLQK